ncbi:hypothetical protein GUJ93_ZPchr0009g1851 [Zizania palustris]|uniref:Uncharacterized protein n=1 Tax=Zizania palustris TaxID=103762 RepID=A0A8J5UZF1_ZIZPA|nr:hypothetical protein GUJ93_ZPchr0009g1851 [Zizania palustris]
MSPTCVPGVIKGLNRGTLLMVASDDCPASEAPSPPTRIGALVGAMVGVEVEASMSTGALLPFVAPSLLGLEESSLLPSLLRPPQLLDPLTLIATSVASSLLVAKTHSKELKQTLQEEPPDVIFSEA